MAFSSNILFYSLLHHLFPFQNMAFSSNILFYSLRAAHSGSYTCLASNRADTVNFTAQLIVKGRSHRVHRVVTAAFWRTFHHEGKISSGW
jgi:hypothetical protein